MAIHVQLYTSLCPKNEYYLKFIDRMLKKSGLEYTLQRVTDEDLIQAKGLDIACIYNYCPGCKTMHKSLLENDAGYRCVPAIFIDGEMKFCGWIPDEFEMESMLKQQR